MAEPIDVQSMRVVLEGMGVKEYDDKVVFQLYEFVYRYTCEILLDAKEYCTFAHRTEVDEEDVELAIESRLNHHYCPVPSRNLMMELAEKKNQIPLPMIPDEYGIHLPPYEFQLVNEDIVVCDLNPTTNIHTKKAVKHGNRNKQNAKQKLNIKLLE